MLTASILSIVVAISFLSALLLTPLVRVLAIRLGAVDQPGERKIHTGMVPRLGGVSVVLSGAIACLAAYMVERSYSETNFFDPNAWTPIVIGGALILFIGVWDDVRSAPPWVKFLFQALAAITAMWFGVRIELISWFGGGPLELEVLAYPLTFIWIVGLTNAFNLVDGLDGLAAGLASIAAGTCAVIFLLRGDELDAMLLLILAGALLGFLRYNFHPATIFLGDSGSLFVGYVLAITAVTGSQKGATTLAVAAPLLVFGLPIVDTILSMIRRFVGGLRMVHQDKAPIRKRLWRTASMFQADQRHIHHRLVDLGFSHLKAVLTLYALGLGLACLALMSVLAHYRNVGIILFVVGLATYIGIQKLGYEEVRILRSGILLQWYEQFALDRRFFLGFADIVLISLGYWGAFALKYSKVSPVIVNWYAEVFPLVLLVQLSVFWIFGLYRGVWRAMGIADLIRIGLAVGAAVALSFSLAIVSRPPFGTMGFFGTNLFVLGTLLVVSRSGYRILDHLRQRGGTVTGTALIYGAGRGGQLVVRELLQNQEVGLRPLGFLDDDPKLQGKMLDRMPIFGNSGELGAIMEAHPVAALVISSDKINGHHLDHVVRFCREREIVVLRARLHIEPLEANGHDEVPAYAYVTKDGKRQANSGLSSDGPDWLPQQRSSGGGTEIPVPPTS